MTAPEGQNSIGTGAPRQRTILVADDEPFILMSLEFLLLKAGFRVRTACNGKEVLQSMADEAPDLLLLDVMMPELDGFSACQQIRSNPAWSDLPVIMLTAKSREVDRQKGMALGATDYVVKPFSTRELVEKVRGHLDGKARLGATA